MDVLEAAALEDILDIVICRVYGKNGGIAPEAGELLESYINEIAGRAMHYCHLYALPEGLHDCVAAMCVDLIKSEGLSLTGASLAAELEEVRLGDARFGFGHASSVSQQIVDGLLRDYRADLHHYRKLKA